MGRKEHDEQSEEVRAVRQHTAASIFNAVYEALREEIVTINGADDLEKVAAGDIVEITGEVIGNPLEELVGFFAQAVPYFALSAPNDEAREAAAQVDVDAVQAEVAALQRRAEELRKEAADARRSGNPGRRSEAEHLIAQAEESEAKGKEALENAAEALKPLLEWQEQNRGVLMLGQMRDDLAKSPVHDSVLKGAGLQAVLTLSSEFFTDATSAYLRSGVFTAVGKLTRVLDPEDTINLLRRSVLGAAGPDFGRSLIKDAAAEGELQIPIFDPIIEAPAVQILPLAVYI